MKRICGLYLVLDTSVLKREDVFSVARQAIAGGVSILQLRDKSGDALQAYLLAKQLLKITRLKKRLLIINDRVDIAVASNADGVHLGQSDLPADIVRNILGTKKIIGLSSHSLPQAVAAAKLPLDYVSVGPIFKSPTKPLLKPVGLELLEKVAGAIDKPIVAIGGITAQNINLVLCSGASSAAVISAVLKEKNIKIACQNMLMGLKKPR